MDDTKSQSDVPTVLKVSAATIAQLEKKPPDESEMYRHIFNANRELALWLRRRASVLVPDIEDREAAMQLALEALMLLHNQMIIDELGQHFSLGKCSAD